jgi:hypothetical protein
MYSTASMRSARSFSSTLAKKVEAEALTGWNQISAFSGHPATVLQRWASEGCRFVDKVGSSLRRRKNRTRG